MAEAIEKQGSGGEGGNGFSYAGKYGSEHEIRDGCFLSESCSVLLYWEFEAVMNILPGFETGLDWDVLYSAAAQHNIDAIALFTQPV